MTLTESRLKELLNYDISTGEFTWIKKPNKRIVIGSVAGSVCRHGYIKIKIDGFDYKAHRLAWFYVKGY